MGRGIPCPLCEGHTLPDIARFSAALTRLVVSTLTCPVAECGQTVEGGVTKLARHVATHTAQQQTPDLDQVIRDIEELVGRENIAKVENILELSESKSCSSHVVDPHPSETSSTVLILPVLPVLPGVTNRTGESQTIPGGNVQEYMLESPLAAAPYQASHPTHTTGTDKENNQWGETISPAQAGSNIKAEAFSANQPSHIASYTPTCPGEGQVIFPQLFLQNLNTSENGHQPWQKFCSPMVGTIPSHPAPLPYPMQHTQSTHLFHSAISCSKLKLPESCTEEVCPLPAYRQETENINQLSNSLIPLQSSPDATSKPRDPRLNNQSSPFVSQLKVIGQPLHTKSAPYKKPQTPVKSPGSRTTSSSSEVECAQCGWMFDNASFLHLHKVLMHSRRKETKTMTLPDHYTCKQCPNDKTIFLLYDLYTEHLHKVHNDHRHVCKFCAKLFKLKGSLLVHQRVMHQPINARVTNLLAKRKEEIVPGTDPGTDISTHGMKTEAGANNLDMKTDVCGVEVSSNTKLFHDHTSHLKDEPLNATQEAFDLEKGEIVFGETKVEISQISGDFQCNICSKTFPQVCQYEAHLKSHDSKLWDCNYCGKKFTTKYFLKKHRRLHTGETPYSCNLCGKTFSFQQSYHKHMLYHTDEKPYSCPSCGRAFKELSTLQNHERIHTGERPFVCETCGKSFRQRVSYLVHRRIHTGVMPYSCQVCGKKFRYKVTQRTHKCPGKCEEDNPNTATENIEHPDVEPHKTGSRVSKSCHLLSEDTARLPSARISRLVPPLPEEIKQNLLKFRQAQGRRQLSHRLQNILEMSHSHTASQVTQPLAELSQLSLDDGELGQWEQRPAHSVPGQAVPTRCLSHTHVTVGEKLTNMGQSEGSTDMLSILTEFGMETQHNPNYLDLDSTQY